MVLRAATRESRAQRVLRIEEMRARARSRLPKAVFDVIDGGAGDELSVRGNRMALDRIWIRPRALADLDESDMSTTVLGQRISLPVMIAPCSFSRMCDSAAEVAINRAAGAANTIYVVAGGAYYELEEIRRHTDGPCWYQMYAPPSRDETRALVERAKSAGYDALVITVDTAVNPIRPRDYYNGLTVPLTLTPSLIRHGLSRPAWSRDFLFGRVGQATKVSLGAQQTVMYMREFARMVAWVRSVTLEELAWIKELWGGPLVVKGILRGDEVPAMIDVGVDAVIVSNHGGRNLHGARPTIDCLPEVVDAAAGRIEVYVDGGIHRGSDVVKALALGARAVLIGRAHMYGLAAYGEAGVSRVIEILRHEFGNTMALAGCRTVTDVDRGIVCYDLSGRSPEDEQARDGLRTR